MSAAAPLGVSYVITVFNKRPYLPGMIAGLAAQQGAFAREFIFVDDGSTDGSGAEIARLTAGWPETRIIAQSNQGPSYATNRGIGEARHPYIKLVDADDILMPRATALLLQGLQRFGGAVLAYGRSEFYASEQEVAEHTSRAAAAPPPAYRLDPDPLPDLLLRGFSVGPSNSLFLAAAARATGGCDHRVFTQDYSLALRLATAGSLVYADTVVALCPALSNQRINDGGPQILHDANLTLAYFLAEQPLPPALVRSAVKRATTRAYHWAKRREGAGFLSYWAWLRVLAEFPLARPQVGLIRQSCSAFTLSRPVRLGST